MADKIKVTWAKVVMGVGYSPFPLDGLIADIPLDQAKALIDGTAVIVPKNPDPKIFWVGVDAYEREMLNPKRTPYNAMEAAYKAMIKQ